MSDDTSGRRKNNTSAANHPAKPEASAPNNAPKIETLRDALQRKGFDPAEIDTVASVFMSVETYHSSPLPSVETFAGYEKICPGAARDILDMAKSQQAHIQYMEKAELNGDISLKKIGMFAAVFVIALMIAAAVFAAISGHDGLAITIVSGVGIASVAGAFLRHHLSQPEKPEPKKEKPKQIKKR